MVLTILNVLLEFYESYVQRVSTQKTFPNFDQLISRLFQEVQRKELYVEITPKQKNHTIEIQTTFQEEENKHSVLATTITMAS